MLYKSKLRPAIDLSQPYNEKTFNRLISRISFCEDGHWRWRGKLTKNNQRTAGASAYYIQFGYWPPELRHKPPRPIRGHEIMWRMLVGDIPAGYRLWRCPEDKRCLNPDHMRISNKYDPFSVHNQIAFKAVEIIKESPKRVTLSSLGKEYGVSREAIRLVLKGIITGAGRNPGKLTEKDCEDIRRRYHNISITKIVRENLGVEDRRTLVHIASRAARMAKEVE